MKKSKVIQIIYLLGIAIIMLAGCTKAPLISVDHAVIFPETQTRREWTPVTVKNVTIKYIKGQHFTLATLFASQPTNRISFNLTFDSTAIYFTVDPDNQVDYSKICGIKSGADGRVNSLQLVWSYDISEGCIKLSPYPQADKYRFYCFAQQDAIPLQIGETIHMELINEYDKFFVIIGSHQYEILKADYWIKNYHNGLSIMPTAGGQETFDHDVYLYL